ncbi:MAG: PRC-barrel domain-containing protein [Armatimonadota bacterium]
MLRSLQHFRELSILATDGEIGQVDDVYVDDESWTIRYWAVSTGPWLFGRRVLLSPRSVEGCDWARKQLRVKLTREQVKNAPAVDLSAPVTRRWEADYHRYYGFPFYWGPASAWGAAGVWGWPMGPAAAMGPIPSDATPGEDDRSRWPEEELPDEPRIKSGETLKTFTVVAEDGQEIGNVDDLLVDDADGRVRYLAIDTGSWWSGRKVLLSPDWIQNTIGPEGVLTVCLTRDAVRLAPEWSGNTPPTREYEEQLCRHYHRARYWDTPAEKLAA